MATYFVVQQVAGEDNQSSSPSGRGITAGRIVKNINKAIGYVFLSFSASGEENGTADAKINSEGRRLKVEMNLRQEDEEKIKKQFFTE